VQRETLLLTRDLEDGKLEGAYEERDQEEPLEGLAITLSNTANVVLLILKVFVDLNRNLSLGLLSSSGVVYISGIQRTQPFHNQPLEK
jgi:hypothetical protein